MLGRAAQRDDVAFPQYKISIRSQRLAAPQNVCNAIFGIDVAELGNADSNLGGVLQPVSAQSELAIAGQPAAFEILHAKFLLVLLRRRPAVDAPPPRQALADQYTAHGAPDVADPIGQC